MLLSAPLAAKPPAAEAQTPAAKSEEQSLPIEELRAFAEIFGRIKNDYVEEISDRKLIEQAVRGMVSGLDPHSSYLNSDEYQDLQEGTSGVFGGLGIEVGMENGFVKVISPIDDTPAEKAGLKPGDLIIKLDGKSVKGMSLDDAVKIMRGEPGSKIDLTLMREGVDKPIELSIERAIIKVKSVKHRMLQPGLGYVRLTTFQSRSLVDLTNALNRLQEQAKGQLKGLVLDLRNNPGGVLTAAVAISDAFLEDGLIVYTEGRLENSETRFSAGPGDLLQGAPLVVLVNGGSASASEIVAGALQDRQRAVIMGSQTFGKGSVQTVIPVGKNGALKLTTARYFTPSGRSIQAEGIVPDILIADREIVTKETETNQAQVKEADLARHLNNGKEKDEAAKKQPEPKKAQTDDDDLQQLLEKDYVLNEALNLLKGLSIFKARSHADASANANAKNSADQAKQPPAPKPPVTEAEEAPKP
ncbi:MAG: S41 family peptidase [Gammaproteobacteria bacterium]|nr:S41 family peptidase [Gammaproteobacteria bacterium]